MSSWIVCFALTSGMLSATPEKLDWNTDYGKALEATRANSKPLLIVLDKPGEEKSRIRPVRFQPDPTARELLKPYELCHVDVTTSYGQKVAKAFKAEQFPFTAIIDRTGKRIIYKKAGSFTTTDWAVTLMAYKGGLDPAECFT